MREYTFRQKALAAQFKFGESLPEGFHLCQPEVHWSADHKFIYFTYADLRPEHWLGVEELAARPPESSHPGIFAPGHVGYTPHDGSAPYFRAWLNFRIWDVKSEASRTGDHRPVYLDAADPAMVKLWHDFCSAEQFPNPIPRMAEYRVVDGKYGRGFRPIYLKDGDWLVKFDVPEGHNNLGRSDAFVVMSDAEFRKGDLVEATNGKAEAI